MSSRERGQTVPDKTGEASCIEPFMAPERKPTANTIILINGSAAENSTHILHVWSHFLALEATSLFSSPEATSSPYSLFYKMLNPEGGNDTHP